MNTRYTCALVTFAALLMAPALAWGADDPALTELVQILREKGVIEEDQYQALALKAAAQEKKRSWTDRVSIFGDFRARYEDFFFFDDPVNGNALLPDRHRFRIRLRLNANGEVNDYSSVRIRLVTGDDARTLNESLGTFVDNDHIPIFIQHAYVKMSPFRQGAIPEAEGTLWFYYGLTDMPWRWDDIFKDWLLWDDELSPQGGYFDTRLMLTDSLGLRSNGGIYVMQENSGWNLSNAFPAPTSKDPKMANLQIRLDDQIDERFGLGGRFTWYYLFDLTNAFLQRGIDSRAAPSPVATFAAGNLPGGFTGDPNGGEASVVNFSAYAKADLIERWPILILFDYARNLDASDSFVTYTAGVNPPPVTTNGTFNTSEQGNAWLVGLQVGDSAEILRFRMNYAWLEANSFPAQFVDSDIFDQFTNRKGWVWDISKKVFTNTEANLTMFWSDPIKTNPAYQNSLYGSRRFRMQANVVWSF